MKSKSILLIAVFVLLLINLFIISSFTLFESRIIRVLSTFTFFVFFILYKGYKEVWIFIAFLCFLVSDYLMIYYEVPFYNKLTSIITICGYFSLIYHVLNGMTIGRINAILIVFHAFFVLLYFYGFYQIMNNIEAKLDDYFQRIILYLYGTTIITVCAFATNYKKGITKSMYFIFFVFAFSFSDFFAVLAYYFDIHPLYYIDRTIYICALFFMVHYTLIIPSDNDYLLG